MVGGLQYVLQVTVVDDNCSCVCIFNERPQTNGCHSFQLHLHPPSNQQLLTVVVCCSNISIQHLYLTNHHLVVWWHDELSRAVEICDSCVAGSIPVGQCCIVIIITRAINVYEMTKSLLRHDTKQSREAALEEVSL